MAAPSAQKAPGGSRTRGAADPSGRLLLRMPRALHGALAQAASREGTSLNQFITGTLAGAIGWSEDGSAPPAREPQPGTPAAAAPGAPSRALILLLVANAAVVGLAALAAVGLLLVAWLG